MDWFLYDVYLHHEKVKTLLNICYGENSIIDVW